MRLAEDIQPGLFEKLTDKQLDIIDKYGDLIDRDLLKNIVLDPDPNNQAAAIATIEQVKTMGDKGMGIDEIMNVLQSTPRLTSTAFFACSRRGSTGWVSFTLFTR